MPGSLLLAWTNTGSLKHSAAIAALGILVKVLTVIPYSNFWFLIMSVNEHLTAFTVSINNALKYCMCQITFK